MRFLSDVQPHQKKGISGDVKDPSVLHVVILYLSECLKKPQGRNQPLTYGWAI